ncbi:Conserved region in glutamate synthase [Geosmithia morbida]|uniref:L-lactate dehydrogenase (cytochrome) n=1 Tax=Geosmithia morbida TaxID=1094350 RepID=A0A9P4YV31_9HYPO|nr:Conserved region in glutamate synthase [Geosmithia morbida]KAF4123360.1 Conserved region in glutamate synthase [Geosmithia morbida]
MAKTYDAADVAKHNTSDSCWVVLYGNVYDVTDFLPEHPGGERAILSLAGKDATEEYDPIHPPGALEDNLKADALLGHVDPDTLPKGGEEGLEASSSSAASSGANGAGGGAGSSSDGGSGSGGGGDDGDNKPKSKPLLPLQALLNLDDIEEEATKRISKRAWAYYFSAGDDLISKRFNNAVYKDILLRPRVFVDCTECNLSTTLLGHRVGLPLYVSPAAMARLAHPDGEHGIAKAAARFGAMQIVSNSASMTPEQIAEGAAPGQIFGWQLYVQMQRAKSEAMLRRINAMSDRFKFICLTLDAPVPGKREHDERTNIDATFTVESASEEKPDGEKRPGSSGVGRQLFFGTATDLTWKTTLPWLAEHTHLPIVLKGIQTHEDVYLAAKYAPQVKAVILSNHGGRALDTAPPAVHTLLEIRKYCPEVFGKIEIWVDGGIKRGTDVVKALCLGANAVGIGRGPLFGLGAGGQAGVERVLEILEAETATCMRLLGAKSVSDLGPHFINSRRVERDIYDGEPGLDKGLLWTKSKL